MQRMWLLHAVTGAEAQCCLSRGNGSVTALIWFTTWYWPPSAELQDLPREVFAVDPTNICQTPNTEVLYRCRKCRYWTFSISPWNVILKLTQEKNSPFKSMGMSLLSGQECALAKVSIPCLPQKIRQIKKVSYEIQTFLFLAGVQHLCSLTCRVL